MHLKSTRQGGVLGHHQSIYQEALDKASYNHKLVSNEPAAPKPSSRLPDEDEEGHVVQPSLLNQPINTGQKFQALLDTCFPPDHELRKVIICNTVKVSYSTMPNMGQNLNHHNTKVRKEKEQLSGGCSKLPI